MRIFTFFFLLFLASSLGLRAQEAVGEWKAHFSGKNAKDLCSDEKYIHVACEQMLYRYNYTGIDKIYTRINGLSDTDLKFVRKLSEDDSYILVYENSNIDILKNGTFYNFADIKNKQLSGDKSIYDIHVRGNEVWLSCGFGIVKFDTKEMEFSDTYYIGADGDFTKVCGVDFSEDYVYAATTEGLKRASLSTGALYNFNNWELINLPENKSADALGIVDGTIYVNLRNADDTEGSLYYSNGSGWQLFEAGYTNVAEIFESESFLIFTLLNGQTRIHTKDGELWEAYTAYGDGSYGAQTHINRVAEAPTGELFFADGRNSLVKPLSDGTHEFISPGGPFTNAVMQLEIINRHLVGTAGGFLINLNPANREASLFKYNLADQVYTNVVKTGHRSFYSIASPDKNQDHLFIGTWNQGLYELQGDEILNIYDETNSSLQSILPNYQSVRIGGLAYDDSGNLFMTNSFVGEPMSVYTNDGQWLSFAHSETIPKRRFFKLMRTADGNFWAGAAQTEGGLYVFNTNGTPTNLSDDDYKFFIPRTSDNNESSTDVRSMAQDKDGTVWIGTSEGIFVYYYPERIFDEAAYAERIQLTAVGADTSEQYLLKTEMVTAIAVDGANRKWLGTQTAGVFLVSPNGKDQILAFNTENSPLPSNTINDIEIDPETGRVYFATGKGLISYRAEATEGSDYFENVYVFPNPVRPGYEGVITVTGLMPDTNVKITDVAGNLVYETESLGGQAVWEGTNMNGQKVSTGVYLVFCSSPDGTETHVTKLLFVK